jgi:hypothetical protein
VKRIFSFLLIFSLSFPFQSFETNFRGYEGGGQYQLLFFSRFTPFFRPFSRFTARRVVLRNFSVFFSPVLHPISGLKRYALFLSYSESLFGGLASALNLRFCYSIFKAFFFFFFTNH